MYVTDLSLRPQGPYQLVVKWAYDGSFKLSTYTGHMANTYIHTQGTTQGTKTRHTDKAQRQGTQNQAHKTRQTVSTHLDPKHFSSHQGSVLP